MTSKASPLLKRFVSKMLECNTAVNCRTYDECVKFFEFLDMIKSPREGHYRNLSDVFSLEKEFYNAYGEDTHIALCDEGTDFEYGEKIDFIKDEVVKYKIYNFKDIEFIIDEMFTL